MKLVFCLLFSLVKLKFNIIFCLLDLILSFETLKKRNFFEKNNLFCFTVVLLQVCLMILTFYLASHPVWSFEPADIVAAFFCSTHKSLTLGMYHDIVTATKKNQTDYVTISMSKVRLFPLSQNRSHVVHMCGVNAKLHFSFTGIPILKIVYEGDPHLSVMSIPLLIYHPTQILLGGLIVPSVRGWMSTTKGFR